MCNCRSGILGFPGSLAEPVVGPAEMETDAPLPVLQRVMAAMTPTKEEAPVAAEVGDWQRALDPMVLLDRYPILRSAT